MIYGQNMTFEEIIEFDGCSIVRKKDKWNILLENGKLYYKKWYLKKNTIINYYPHRLNEKNDSILESPYTAITYSI